MGCKTLLACFASAIRGSSRCMLCIVARRTMGGTVFVDPPVESQSTESSHTPLTCFVFASTHARTVWTRRNILHSVCPAPSLAWGEAA